MQGITIISNREQYSPPAAPPNKGSTYNRAMPYALSTLAVGGMGAVLAFSAASAVGIVAGAVLAMMGSYGFIGVLLCATAHPNDPDSFEKNIGKCITTAAGIALSEIIRLVAQVVLIDLICGRRR